MIFGIGTDIIEVDGFEERILKTPGLLDDIFGPEEVSYCESKRYKYRHYAARYAAKEAFFKALGTGWRYGMKYIEIVVINDDAGKPIIRLKGIALSYFKEKALKHIHLSMTHHKNVVNSVVIIEK